MVGLADLVAELKSANEVLADKLDVAEQRIKELCGDPDTRVWCCEVPSVVKGLDEKLDAYLAKLEQDAEWMTREDAIAHYVCAMASWNTALDELETLRKEVKSKLG